MPVMNFHYVRDGFPRYVYCTHLQPLQYSATQVCGARRVGHERTTRASARSLLRLHRNETSSCTRRRRCKMLNSSSSSTLLATRKQARMDAQEELSPQRWFPVMSHSERSLPTRHHREPRFLLSQAPVGHSLAKSPSLPPPRQPPRARARASANDSPTRGRSSQHRPSPCFLAPARITRGGGVSRETFECAARALARLDPSVLVAEFAVSCTRASVASPSS